MSSMCLAHLDIFYTKESIDRLMCNVKSESEKELYELEMKRLELKNSIN